ncbi:hypothetical protein JDV02_008914 [Purpureocillium takamizusanense]|uniref:Uncharacterized protein n=1 Tax=Purpureocillium takamizusanense TaxID=2060973 RepID=A0A9Q8VFM8_9HYPO|nr:uncharacterized protein JDV02_008914 [Purpureocillium takamizusanense]UNI23074.1 hypothetical protein JDV02_008914 [Purpureocillium takamizusanense]
MDREPQTALLGSPPSAAAAVHPEETRQGLLSRDDNELADLGAKEAPEAAPLQGPLPTGRWAPAGSINGTYQRANLCLVALWLLSFIVLGASASALPPAMQLPEVIPLAAYAVACSVVHILLLFLQLRTKPASSASPRPPLSYLGGTAVSAVMWAGAVGCAVPMLLWTRRVRGERDESKTTYHCGKYSSGPCHPYTARAVLFERAVFVLVVSCLALTARLAQCYVLSGLWRRHFTPQEIKAARLHDAPAPGPRMSLRQAWLDGWRQGWTGGK